MPRGRPPKNPASPSTTAPKAFAHDSSTRSGSISAAIPDAKSLSADDFNEDPLERMAERETCAA